MAAEEEKIPAIDYFKCLFQYDIDYLDDEPAFRCLRGAFHVVNVSKCLILLEFVGFALAFLFLFPVCLLWILPHFLLILCTIYALKREKPRFMWPIIIFAASEFVLWCILSVFSFTIAIFSNSSFLGFFGQDHHEDFFVRLLIVIIIKALLLTFAAFLFWRFAVFRSTRIYYERKMDGSVPPPPEETSALEKLMTPV